MEGVVRLNPIAARMQGPGGYYNAGNLIGFATSVWLQLWAATEARRSGADAVLSYLVGSPVALSLTTATLIFLVGGEVYYRAWKDRSVPDPRLNRLGDLLSALGALALTFGLAQLGHPELAIASGLLIIAGKLGNALFGDGTTIPGWPMGWGDPFRLAVLLGRLPAIFAICADLTMLIGASLDGRSSGPQLVQVAVLALCHVLWVKADLMLLVAARKTGPA